MRTMVFSYNKLSLSIFFLLLIPNHIRAGKQGPQPVVDGLSWNFYDHVCPNLESLIREHLMFVLKEDVGQAAGFLHLYLQDCFSQGCDASVLFKGPSPSLRPVALKAINDVGNIVRKECGRLVSCSDIITIAVRDAIYLAGGPDYAVPLGRRDSPAVETIKETTQVPFPSTSSTTSAILNYFEQINFDATDVVAISGAHTLGLSHCSNFNFRLHPKLDPTVGTSLHKLLLGSVHLFFDSGFNAPPYQDSKWSNPKNPKNTLQTLKTIIGSHRVIGSQREIFVSQRGGGMSTKDDSQDCTKQPKGCPKLLPKWQCSGFNIPAENLCPKHTYI